METVQFLLRIEPELRNRLDRCAEKGHYPTTQEFVKDALDAYAELLLELLKEELEQTELLRRRQRNQLLSPCPTGESESRRRK